jgi:hypothetical protein
MADRKMSLLENERQLPEKELAAITPDARALKNGRETSLVLTHLVSIVLAALLLLPFVLYLYSVLVYSINVPFADDYDNVLLSLIKLLQAQNLEERVKLVFEQQNQHRIAFPRLIFLLQYFLWGKTNFYYLIIFGNLGWILTVATLVWYTKNQMGLSLLQTLPIPYLLLTPVHWQNMFWATSAMQVYWVTLFSILCIICLVQNKWGLASLLFPLALFTTGNSIVLYPLGNIYWLLQRQWKRGFIFPIVSTLSILIYFYNYHSHNSLLGSITQLNQTITYFFVFLGGIMPSEPLALIMGCIVFGLLLSFTLIKPGNHFLDLMTSFIFLIAGTAALFRSQYGVEQALSSRYAIYSLLAWILVYLHLMTREFILEQRRILVISFSLSLLLFGGRFLEYELGDVFTRLMAHRIHNLVVKDFSVYPPAAEILATAEKSGIYSYQDLPLYPPEELSPDKLQPTTEFTGEIENYYNSYISGWAFIPGLNAVDANISILLKNDTHIFKLKTIKVNRPDVSKQFKEDYMYNGAGYESSLVIYKIPQGDYQVGILVEHSGQQALQWLDEVVKK